MQKQQLLHYPRLDTVLMVEEAIKKAKEYHSKRQLWLSLPKKIMYQTFNLILEYLEESGKIVIKDGKIIWIWNPKLVEKYLKSKLVVK
jgi:adenylate kinase family enzyme